MRRQKQDFHNELAGKLEMLREQGLYKPERVMASRQGAEVVCDDGRKLINLCANNYLGLSGDEALVKASIAATERYGYGLSSVRFICGTQTVHKELEQALSNFVGMEDAILYAAAFDANMGATGRGTHEHHDVMGRIDIISGTLGKALGGAMGGFTAARKEVIQTLRQKSRPYLFSNTLASSIAGATLSVLQRLSASTELRDRLHANTSYFRKAITETGFTIKPGTHPVVPVMLFDAPLAQKFAQRLYELGVLATGFFYRLSDPLVRLPHQSIAKTIDFHCVGRLL